VTATLGSSAPRFDLDLFSDENLTDPYPIYERFRAAGPVVYLSAIDAYALSRYDDVRAGLGDHETFISGRGIGLSDEGNATRKGVIIASDNPLHDQLRSVLSERLSPKAMNVIRAEIGEKADALVSSVVAKTSFDAVTDLAQAFPLTIVADLIGLPAADRKRLLEWADAGFNLWGPRNERNIRSCGPS
jgi:cytochrome P450